MNKFTIFGIVFFGIGILLISPLIDNSLSILVGIMFQIVGLSLTTKGAIISRREVVQGTENNLKSHFENQIKEFRQELRAAKKLDESDELEVLENKFDRWAQEFGSNKDLRVLELNREEIKKKEHEELLNKRWYKTYISVFSILKGLLRAYSKLPNSNITKIYFPQFPSKLISEEAANYVAKIYIGGNILYILLQVNTPNFDDLIPDIVFTINKEGEDPLLMQHLTFVRWRADTRLIFEISEQREFVYWSKTGGSKFDKDVVKYEIPKSSKEWEDVLKEIIEYVITKSEVKFNYS